MLLDTVSDFTSVYKAKINIAILVVFTFEFYKKMLWQAILLFLMLHRIKAHPLLVECICGVILTDITEIVLGEADNFDQPVAVRNCLNDVFAKTGIRWYLNGPFDGSIEYVRGVGRDYASDRAAERLRRFGYRCTAYPLLDPDEKLD